MNLSKPAETAASEVAACGRCGKAHPPGPCPAVALSETMVRPDTEPSSHPSPVPFPVPPAGTPATQDAPAAGTAPFSVPPAATQGTHDTAPAGIAPAGPSLGSPPTLGPPIPGPGSLSPPVPDAPAQAATRSDVDPLIGQMVGSFRLTRPLGRGGMGTVYAAEHPVIGSHVAIKFLHATLAANDELVRRFYDEARAVNLIGNDNIVSIFDLNQLPPNRYYIVMEMLDGQTLSERLDEGALDLATSRDVLMQLCEALAAAHRHNIIHRDLKPDNIFLIKKGARENFVKLVDFGIAKLRDSTNLTSQTHTGVLVGTPDYMSPEQCDHREVDARSDVYSLGVIAFRLATGRLPFIDTSLARLMMAHLEQPPPKPRSINPALSTAWEDAIVKALAKDPAERHQSMEAFAVALKATQPPAGTRGGTPNPSGAAPPRMTPLPVSKPLVVEVDLLHPPPVRKVKASELSRGGAFLSAEAGLPPRGAAIKVELRAPTAGGVEVNAEVIRQVTLEEAQSWGMQPGVAVQFTGVTASIGKRLDAILKELRAAGAKAGPNLTPTPAHPVVSETLEFFRRQGGATHYAFLGLGPDADFGEIRSRLKAQEDKLGALDGRDLTADQKGAVDAVRARLKEIATTLTLPAARLDYDAQRGNFQGVARCIGSGTSFDDLKRRHHAFLSTRPGLGERIAQIQGRIKIARGRGNAEAALRECEAALALAPLDPDLHRLWAILRLPAK